MNPKLTFEYQEHTLHDGSRHSGKQHLVCTIGIAGCSFTSLGLSVGQQSLDAVQLAWLEAHGDEVVDACEATLKDNSTVGRKFKLLDRFCKDCKIKDS